MLLRRMDGLHTMNRLRDEMDRLLGDWAGDLAQGGPFGLLGGRGYPALNIWEDGDALVAEAELPGLKMEQIEVLVQGPELTIKGERRSDETRDLVYHRQERGAGAFSRVLRLPVEIQADKVEASLKDGVLTIKLPKAELARSRKIAVKTA